MSTNSAAHLISAAQGWLELGNPAEALRELAKIPSSACNLDVLRLRFTAFAVSEEWQAASMVAEVAVQLYEQQPEPWLWRAEAFRAVTGRAEEAYQVLRKACQLFPGNAAVSKAFAEYAAAASDQQK